MDNATLLLQIDNAKLAEDDFKNKYIAHRVSFPRIKPGLSVHGVRARSHL